MTEKRYNLKLSEKDFQALDDVASERHTTMLEIITHCIRIGLALFKAQARGAAIIIREADGKEKEIMLL